MPEQNIALELADVEFRRRGRVILTKVNLKINKGEKWVLFGPNGIGKSSLVQMMSTRGFPSEGNYRQYSIVKILAEKHRNIFAVGDDDQAIYGFRGARPACMRQFVEEDRKSVV